MKLKRVFKVTALTMMLSFGSITAQAGLPVVDVPQITNQIQTWLVEAQRWQERIQQYKQDFTNQINQLKTQHQQLASITGLRDIQGFLTDMSRELENVSNLEKWLNNTDNILRNGKDILGGSLRKTFDSYGLDTVLCKNLTDKQKKHCEGTIIVDAVRQEQNQRTLKKIDTRIKDIEKISQQMKAAKDQKEAQDLSNAILVQVAMLQADKLAMDLALSQEELYIRQEEKQREKLKHEELRKGITHHGTKF